MKKRIAVLRMILVGLGVSLVGFGVVANLDLDRTLQPYLSAIGAEARQLDWSSIHKGYISQRAVYQTNDDVRKAWHGYAQRFGVVPADGMGAEGGCALLTQTDEQVVFRRQVSVRLCPAIHGTQVFFNQVLYLLW